MQKILMATLLATMSAAAPAQEFSQVSQCVPGLRVVDRKGLVGEIVEVSNGMCKVRKDADGSFSSYLHWMLRPAGASAKTSDELGQGVYHCYTLAGSTINYAFIDIHIDGPERYRDQRGEPGKFRLEKSGKIVFESGPLVIANAKLLAGPRIGLNMDGGSFYNVTCSQKK